MRRPEDLVIGVGSRDAVRVVQSTEARFPYTVGRACRLRSVKVTCLREDRT